MTILQLGKQAAPPRTLSARWLFAGLTQPSSRWAEARRLRADIFTKLLLISTLSLSFNFLFGIAGQLAISHVALYAIGALYGDHPLGLAGDAGMAGDPRDDRALRPRRARRRASHRAPRGFYLALGTLALSQSSPFSWFRAARSPADRKDFTASHRSRRSGGRSPGAATR